MLKKKYKFFGKNKKKKPYKLARIMRNKPQNSGVVTHIRITSPRKPNSARRKTVRLKLKIKLIAITYIFIPSELSIDSRQNTYNIEVLWLEYIIAVMYPLQGFLNFFVFVRPNIMQWTKVFPNNSLWWALRMEISSVTPPPTNLTTAKRQSNRNINNNSKHQQE